MLPGVEQEKGERRSGRLKPRRQVERSSAYPGRRREELGATISLMRLQWAQQDLNLRPSDYEIEIAVYARFLPTASVLLRYCLTNISRQHSSFPFVPGSPRFLT